MQKDEERACRTGGFTPEFPGGGGTCTSFEALGLRRVDPEVDGLGRGQGFVVSFIILLVLLGRLFRRLVVFLRFDGYVVREKKGKKRYKLA